LRYRVELTFRFLAFVFDDATARFTVLDARPETAFRFTELLFDTTVFFAVFDREGLFLVCAAKPKLAATHAQHTIARRIRFIRPSHLPSRFHIDRSPPVSTPPRTR
jgi:hypothetical protein